jgi:hypothetical protein
MPLSTQGVDNVKAVLDGVVKEGATGINGIVFMAIDRKGDTLVEHATGTKGVNSKEPLEKDTTFCKLLTLFSFCLVETRC